MVKALIKSRASSIRHTLALSWLKILIVVLALHVGSVLTATSAASCVTLKTARIMVVGEDVTLDSRISGCCAYCDAEAVCYAEAFLNGA